VLAVDCLLKSADGHTRDPRQNAIVMMTSNGPSGVDVVGDFSDVQIDPSLHDRKTEFA